MIVTSKSDFRPTFDEIERLIIEDQIDEAAKQVSDIVRDFNPGEYSHTIDLWRRARALRIMYSRNAPPDQIDLEKSKITIALMECAQRAIERIQTGSVDEEIHEPAGSKLSVLDLNNSRGSKLSQPVSDERDQQRYDLTAYKEKIGLFSGAGDANSERLVQLESLSYGYKTSKKVLNSVDLKIELRRIVCVTGENGSGKSTLLKLLAKELDPTDGVINFEPNLMYGESNANLFSILLIGAERKQWVGTISESLSRLSASVHGVGDQAGLILHDALLRYNLDDLTDRQFHQLSTGQQLRVDFARAAIIKPKLLLLDEPFANLSATGRLALSNYLIEAIANREWPTSIVLTSHHQTEIDAICDDNLYINSDGKLNPLSDDRAPLLRVRVKRGLQGADLKEILQNILETEDVANCLTAYFVDRTGLIFKFVPQTDIVVVGSIILSSFGTKFLAFEDISSSLAQWEAYLKDRWTLVT